MTKIYGVAEVAAKLGAKPGTVSAWVRRGKMPEPDARLSMGPVWLATTIEPWMKATER
jgi:hypothetical protein